MRVQVHPPPTGFLCRPVYQDVQVRAPSTPFLGRPLGQDISCMHVQVHAATTPLLAFHVLPGLRGQSGYQLHACPGACKNRAPAGISCTAERPCSRTLECATATSATCC